MNFFFFLDASLRAVGRSTLPRKNYKNTKECMMVISFKKKLTKALICISSLMSLYPNVGLVGYPCAEEGCAFQGKTWTEYQAHRKTEHRGNLFQLGISVVILCLLLSYNLCFSVQRLCSATAVQKFSRKPGF